MIIDPVTCHWTLMTVMMTLSWYHRSWGWHCFKMTLHRHVITNMSHLLLQPPLATCQKHCYQVKYSSIKLTVFYYSSLSTQRLISNLFSLILVKSALSPLVTDAHTPIIRQFCSTISFKVQNSKSFLNISSFWKDVSVETFRRISGVM